MLIDDIVQLSYLLKFNLLEEISRKILSHIHVSNKRKENNSLVITMNTGTKSLTIQEKAVGCDFLKEINIGTYLKELTKKNGWGNKDIANRLHCGPSLISYYFSQKSLKIKKIIELSLAFEHNIIAEVYLSAMCISPDPEQFNDCIISITEQEVRITNTKYEPSFWIYKRL